VHNLYFVGEIGGCLCDLFSDALFAFTPLWGEPFPESMLEGCLLP
jgi:hypothetical protein